MQQKNQQECFALLAKVADKLMKTYSEIKAICELGLNQETGENGVTNNSVNVVNQIKNVMVGSNRGLTDQSKNKKVESKPTLQKQQNTNNQTLQPAKAQTKSIDLTKQKIGNNMNRLQEKMSKMTTEDKKVAKKPTTTTGNSGFLLYFQERQPQLTPKFPNLSITEICQKITEEWQNLDAAKKESYQKGTKPTATISSLPPKLKLENEGYKAAVKTPAKNIQEAKKQEKSAGKKRKNSVSEAEAEQINYVSEGESDIQMMEDIYNEEEDEEIENS